MESWSEREKKRMEEEAEVRWPPCRCLRFRISFVVLLRSPSIQIALSIRLFYPEAMEHYDDDFYSLLKRNISSRLLLALKMGKIFTRE